MRTVGVTGWLPHTTRTALTGLRKKGHGRERSKRDGATCYCLLAAAGNGSVDDEVAGLEGLTSDEPRAGWWRFGALRMVIVLMVAPDPSLREARLMRSIFTRYLEFGKARLLADKLAEHRG